MTAALLLVWSFFLPNLAQNPPAESQKGGFVFRVEQKKSDVPIPASREIKLKKKFFDLVFEFADPQPVHVVCTFDSLAFVQARNGVPAFENMAFENWGVNFAENDAPGGSGMMMKKGTHHYWFYENRTKNRFSRHKRATGKITCFRTVGMIDLLDSMEVLSIADIDRPLYVIVASDKGDQCEAVKISWK